MDVGVDADDDIDHLAQIGQTVHAFSPPPDGTWFRSGTEARQDCDETRQAPLTPGGQAPDQASSSNRAGASNREWTGRTKARSQSFRGSHTRSPATAHHHQAALAILTVISPRARAVPSVRRDIRSADFVTTRLTRSSSGFLEVADVNNDGRIDANDATVTDFPKGLAGRAALSPDPVRQGRFRSGSRRRR
ncbi:MAG: hypothetical protein JWN97_2419 [Nocardioides sp.]|nr:hypothetical protein [Nocardioides sp.]